MMTMTVAAAAMTAAALQATAATKMQLVASQPHAS
jgi:hypothetical protein